MKHKTSSTSVIVKIDKHSKSLAVPKELLDMIGLGDGSIVLIEVSNGVIVIKSPGINFGKYIGLLSGKDPEK